MVSEPFRDFDLATDLAAVKRIWEEVGWVSETEEVAQLDHFFACGRTRVATINNVPECAVHTTTGSLQVAATHLKLCGVTAVTTSRVARGQAFAKRLTAEQLLHAKSQGAEIAALGMFDQGFYDQLGFGTGAYDHIISFDPDLLKVNHRVPPPERFTVDDAPLLHQAMMTRAATHGSVRLDPVEMFRAELGFETDSFGLGYKDATGAVTHFLWLNPEGERGPYRVLMMGYQNAEQLLELLGILKSLADQVYSVKLMEPAELQIQSLLDKPFRHRSLTKDSAHMNQMRAEAWWQARILDLAPCVAALNFLPTSVRFNLVLRDPLDDFAEGKQRGLSGSYVVTLGSEGQVEEGQETDLPSLNTSVNALTRLLLGVAPASSLHITDEFEAPVELREALDKLINLPRPVPGLEF